MNRVQNLIVNYYTITTTILRPFVRDCPGEPVPEETFTHSPIQIQPLSAS